ncbi:glycosyltransferase [Pseudonocardia sp. WMMC193]|uniref:glycosyltransferase n=1 Tax=Pseudonocardia sp. WMMC193 TaxID=2911965 RepID=UPI001F3F9984|nr:glycosyltransferase [Pseudonocardia sp. WMMC193]MCF7549373.1 glycosyltransferase [Pseudonocardia sp. WMMC193]
MLSDRSVPGNRWDLLDPRTAPRPEVGVVVCHYEQPRLLARTLAALADQTLPPVDVVVADDGSRHLPQVPAGVRVVTQEDRGFRAAAARNLGARHVRGEILVFLDADTVPEPDCLAVLTARAALCGDVLAVGRRCHADLSALPPGADPRSAPRLPDPAWLDEAYARSRDLLDADGRSFRHVISAVLACRRTLFDDVGGFDERFVGYGGEDWDLAYRAWNAGAVLVRERGAVAWHDGVDWGGRAADPAVKDRESARLAALIPEPHTRGAPLPVAVADVLVDVDPAADPIRTRHALLRQTHRDLRIRGGPAELYGAAVQEGEWSVDQLRRARARLHVTGVLPPTALAAAMARLVDEDLGCVALHSPAGAPLALLRSTRALGRARRGHRGGFGSETLVVEPPAVRGDLAAFFDRI